MASGLELRAAAWGIHLTDARARGLSDETLRSELVKLEKLLHSQKKRRAVLGARKRPKQSLGT